MPVLSENNAITVEKTPAYAHTEYVPERVYNFKKSLKIIMIIRNPVKRFISEMTQVLNISSIFSHLLTTNAQFTLGTLKSIL